MISGWTHAKKHHSHRMKSISRSVLSSRIDFWHFSNNTCPAWYIQTKKPSTITGWWFGTFLFSHSVGNVIIPIDFHIFQRGGPTTNQINHETWILRNSLHRSLRLISKRPKRPSPARLTHGGSTGGSHSSAIPGGLTVEVARASGFEMFRRFLDAEMETINGSSIAVGVLPSRWLDC